MLTKNELWEKAGTKEHITLEDIGIPGWRRDCDAYYYELDSLLCRSGIAYKHKDGFRWSDGSFLTKKQCDHYGLETRRFIMSRGIHRKMTFEDRFYRKYCCGKINHSSNWAKDKKLNRKLFRNRLKRKLQEEIENA